MSLLEKAKQSASTYRPVRKPPWWDRWRPEHTELATEIVDLVQKWKTDTELRRAYPTKKSLAMFIVDLPEVDASLNVVCRQEFWK